MSKTTLQNKLRRVEEEYAEETLQEHLEDFSQGERDNALLTLGAIRAVNKISSILNAESMRTLMQFQEQKVHEALGYRRFDDFLNESDYSPMTKNQFYDRKKVLETEGDVLFNSLNDAGLAISKRKLLGRGNVRLEGETVIITNPDNKEETHIKLTDKNSLLETLTALADSTVELRKSLDREKEKSRRAKEQNTRLTEENTRLMTTQKYEGADTHQNALVTLVIAFKTIEQEAAKLSAEEKDEHAPKTFELIADLLNRLSSAYGRDQTSRDMRELSEDRNAPKYAEYPVSKYTNEAATSAALESCKNDDELAALLD